MRDLLCRIAVLTGLLLAAACSDDDGKSAAGPRGGDSSSATTEEPGESPCGLLGDAEIQALAGTPLEETAETTIAGELPICVWGSLNDVGVHAGLVKASTWARALPEAVEQAQASGLLDDESNSTKLQEAADLIRSGSTIPAEEACGLFGDLVQLNGLPEGADSTVNILPTRDDPQAISGQACRDGSYATVVLVRPDLSGSRAELRRVEAAMEAVISRRSR
jgi:hypothetical protein